jgi:AbiV family abortive infection protein
MSGSVDNERYASAFALSFLALEEIGKVVLELWDASPSVPKSGQRPSSHLRKQAAVSSLLLAQYTTKELSDLVSSGPMTAELIERVARAMYESEAGKFARLVDARAKYAIYYNEVRAHRGHREVRAARMTSAFSSMLVTKPPVNFARSCANKR